MTEKIMARVDVESIAALLERVASLEAEVARLSAGDAKCSSTASKTCETQSGLRTERITLEIVRDEAGERVRRMIARCESVRVVDTHAEAVAESVAWEGARDAYRGRILRLTEERDAAIREREELRKSWLRSEESGTRLLAERNAALDDADGLRKQVAESKDRSHARWVSTNKFSGELAETRRERDEAQARVAELEEQSTRLREDAEASARLMYSANASANEAQDERDALKARVEELEASPYDAIALAQSDRQLQDHRDTEFVPAESVGSGTAERLHRETWLRLERDELIVKRDKLISRVTDLESQLESVACLATTAENRVAELEAASGGGEQEPVAYFVKWADKDWAVQDQTFRTRERAQDYINDEKSEDENPQIVPLYRSPPQPRGWLTEDQKDAIRTAREHLSLGLIGTDENSGWYKVHKRRVDALNDLLARSTPPEVVKPSRGSYTVSSQYAHGWDECDRAYRSAIVKAGVEVKEVGR